MRKPLTIIGAVVLGAVWVSALAVLTSTTARGEGTAVETAYTAYGRVASYRYTVSTGTNGTGGASAATQWLSGEIGRVVVVPGAWSNVCDLTVTDRDGVDILSGLGGNLATGVTVSVVGGEGITDGIITSVVPFQVNSPLTITLTNAGLSATGYVEFLLIR